MTGPSPIGSERGNSPGAKTSKLMATSVSSLPSASTSMASALSEDSLPPRNSSQQSPVSPAIVGDDLSNSGLLDAADKESSIKAVSVCARPPEEMRTMLTSLVPTFTAHRTQTPRARATASPPTPSIRRADEDAGAQAARRGSQPPASRGQPRTWSGPRSFSQLCRRLCAIDAALQLGPRRRLCERGHGTRQLSRQSSREPKPTWLGPQRPQRYRGRSQWQQRARPAASQQRPLGSFHSPHQPRDQAKSARAARCLGSRTSSVWTSSQHAWTRRLGHLFQPHGLGRRRWCISCRCRLPAPYPQGWSRSTGTCERHDTRPWRREVSLRRRARRSRLGLQSQVQSLRRR